MVHKSSLVKSAGKVSLATAFSRILGLVREQVMAYFFGAGLATDAFVTAYRIPNLLRDMFAEGALSSAFVPVFKEKMITSSDQDAFKLASIVLTAILTIVGLIVIIGIIAAPGLIYLIANGFVSNPVKFNLTVDLTRIMFAYLLLVSLSALVMGMLNSFGRFGIPALASSMFNLGVILTVFIFYDFFDQPAYTLAIGVLVGGVGQVAIQLPSLRKIGYRIRLSFNFFDEGLKKILRLIGPMIIGLSAGRINILINTLLASFLIEGAISYLNYSYRLMHFPLGVFAVALGTVALPRVSEMAALKDTEGLSETFHDTININMFVVIPSAVFLGLISGEIVGLIYQWGAFSQVDSANTALALLHYSYGLIGFAAVRVTVPFYYAFGDSKKPMKFSIIAVVVNVLLYYPMIKILNFAGLAAATSIAGLLNFVLLAYYLPTKGFAISYSKIILNVIRMTASALLAFYIARLISAGIDFKTTAFVERLLSLIIPFAIGSLLYLIFCIIFRVKEVQRIRKFIFRR